MSGKLFLVYFWDSLGIEKAISLWVLLRNLDKNDSSSSDEDRSSQNPSAFPSSSLEEEHEESLCLGIFKLDNWKSLDFSSEIFSIIVLSKRISALEGDCFGLVVVL